jgi:eukaryotic-like serine/threonine-protein kinase
MMAKDPGQRYADPAEVVQALEPWAREPIAPPPEKEMPRLSPAAQGAASLDDAKSGSSATKGSSSPPAAARKWESVAPGPAPQLPVTVVKPGATKDISPTKRSEVKPVVTPAAPAASSNGWPPSSPATSDLEAAPVIETGSSPSWDRVAPETDNPMARLETVRQPAPARSGRLSPNRKRKAASATVWEKWRQLDQRVKVGVLLGVGTVGAVFLVWLLLPRPSRLPEGKESPHRHATTFYVNTSELPNSYKTVRDALSQAREGDRILVQTGQLEETLLLEDGKRGKEVTIEAAHPKGPVRWLCPAAVKDGYFIRIANLSGLRLKGFVFDGQNRARDLLVLEGSCPGLVLESLQLQGFQRSALATWNCVGKNEKEPVVVRGLRITGKADSESALAFHANPQVVPGLNKYLLIQECRVEGPYKRAAVEVAGAVVDVELRRNRIFNCTDGVLFAKAPQPYSVRLTLDSNTFYALTKFALHFEITPASGENRLVITNNLFAKTSHVAGVDEENRVPALRALLHPTDNVRDETSAEGNVVLAPAVVSNAVDLPTNANDELRFLRYRIDHALARMGVNQSPVGVPPVE